MIPVSVGEYVAVLGVCYVLVSLKSQVRSAVVVTALWQDSKGQGSGCGIVGRVWLLAV